MSADLQREKKSFVLSFPVTSLPVSVPGVFAVSLVGYILHATGSWSLVFCLVSVVVMSGALVFLVYGSAQRLQLSTTPHK